MNTSRELLKEKAPHGDLMLPMMVHHYSSTDADSMVINPHWHKEYELLLVQSGSAAFSINDHRFDISCGDIVFIRSGCLHSACVTSTDEPFSFTAIVFDEAMLGSKAEDNIEIYYIDAVRKGQLTFPELINKKDSIAPGISQDISRIDEAFVHKAPAYELLSKALLFNIWYRLSSHPAQIKESDKTGSGNITLVKSILTFLQQNYMDEITLADLSSRFGISQGYLCRLFKKSVNMSVIDYLNYCRIQKAAGMLTTTTFSVSEIASNCGYNNISYFNKVFLGFMHQTPTKFRRENA